MHCTSLQQVRRTRSRRSARPSRYWVTPRSGSSMTRMAPSRLTRRVARPVAAATGDLTPSTRGTTRSSRRTSCSTCSLVVPEACTRNTERARRVNISSSKGSKIRSSSSLLRMWVDAWLLWVVLVAWSFERYLNENIELGCWILLFCESTNLITRWIFKSSRE